MISYVRGFSGLVKPTNPLLIAEVQAMMQWQLNCGQKCNKMAITSLLCNTSAQYMVIMLFPVAVWWSFTT